jgi:hypothetical protein
VSSAYTKVPANCLEASVIVDAAQGVLAIWNDIREGRESDFEFWYNNEHFPERLAIPGFRQGRRYEAMSGSPTSFCHYFTDTPSVLESTAYIERLNNPTPLTRSMMSGAFLNMNRTICRRSLRVGILSGAFCVTARFQDALDQQAVLPKLEAFVRLSGIARCELWSAVDQQDDIATEEQLRGGDRKIAACVIVETLRPSDAEFVYDELDRGFGNTADVGVYRLLCELGG